MTHLLGARLAVVSLLLLTLVALAVLVRTTRSVDPCRAPDRLSELTLLPEAVRVQQRRPDDTDEIFMRISGDLKIDPDHLTFTIARSHAVSTTAANWTRLLHLPMDPRENLREIIRVDGEPIAVTWSRERVGQAIHFAGRIQFLGRDVVESPLWTQIRSSFHQLVDGIEPLTLYVIEATTSEQGFPKRRARSTEWLTAAVRHFRSACGNPR